MTGLLGIKNVGAEQRAVLKDNILSVWASANNEQVRAGEDWYPSAHRLALELSDDPRIGAGVIAALSANTGWERNVTCARDAIAGHLIKHTKDASRKAMRIMAGEAPADVLPLGLKTWNFYNNILLPNEPGWVTIDRHAHDLAVGMPYGDNSRGLSTPSRYSLLVETYYEAAEKIGVLPNVLQATTWLVWREGDYRHS